MTIASTIAAGIAGQTNAAAVAAATVAGFGYAFLGSAVLAAIAVAFAVSLRTPKAIGAAAAATVRQGELAGAPAVQSGVGAAETVREMGIRRVLVAVDGSENGYRAAQSAIKLAKDYHAELVVLRVVTRPPC